MQESVDVTGWVFFFFNGGWLKRGWKKRWCTLRDGKVFLYKHQVTNNTNNRDNICKLIDLKYYRKCLQAAQNECKKHSNTLVLELVKPEKFKDKSNQKSEKLHRELFYIVKENEKDRWLSKINEAIVKIQIENCKNLDHVTKFRAKPSGVTRRPPTRKHLRDVATQSQLISGMDFDGTSRTELHTLKRDFPSAAENYSHSEADEHPIKVQVKIAEEKSKENLTSLLNTGQIGSTKSPADSPRHKLLISVKALANDKPTVVVTSPPKQSQSVSPKLKMSSPEVTPTHSLLSSPKSVNPRILQIKSELEKNGEVYNKGSTNLSFMAIEELKKTDDDYGSRTSSPVLARVERLGLMEDSTSVRSTASLDRRNFDHNNEKPTFFENNHRRTSETSVLLKAKALQAHIKFPMLKDINSANNDLIDKAKSKSMPLLDKVDDELPLPPGFPPIESTSDVEIKANNHKKKKKKHKKSKKQKQSK